MDKVDMIIGIMLTICAAEDLFTHKISLWCPAAGLTAGTVLRLAEGTLFTWDCGLGMLAGGIFLLLSIISGQQMGVGDGAVLAVCGICLGWKRLISLTAGAMLLFVAVGVVRMLCGKLNRKKSMAFLPFLWVTFMVFVLWFSGNSEV